MRRMVMVAMALAASACGGESLAPLAVPQLAGTWLRQWPDGGARADAPLPQRLVVAADGRYTIEDGTLVWSLREGLGSTEYGVVREVDGLLQWSVDSLETVFVRWPDTTRRRQVARRPVFIEDHPFGNARARGAGDVLVLSGTNAAIGAPAAFEARFRRVRVTGNTP